MGALIFRRNRILLVERGREPLKGQWSLPGGVVEAGESLEDAIRREVLEETGLVVKPVGLAKVFERILLDEKGKPEYHYVLMDYICRVTRGSLKAADDVARCDWVPQQKLSGYPITEGTLAVINDAFGRRRA